MPILGKETNLFPETLLDGDIFEETGRRWWVLYTKSKQEKAIARELLAQEIPFYLPLVKKITYIRGKAVASRRPLFSGYVFLFGSDEQRVLSLKTNRISRVLTVDEPEQLGRELGDLECLIRSGAPLTIEARLAPGRRVRVCCGPLEGLEGTVVMRRGQTRLLVSVHFLQRGASVEIDDFMLEPIWQASAARGSCPSPRWEASPALLAGQ
jgi:transcriptional antiterminator RfaH